jgi:hypothetical protein
MDLNLLLHRHRGVLMLQGEAANGEERRAYRQFVRDYSVRIQMTRTEDGAPNTTCRFAK